MTRKPPPKQKPHDVMLDRLEASINKLKLEYDIFFNGGADQWPQKLRDALDLEVRRLMNLQGLSYAQAFRLNALASRFRTYNDLWQRQLRAMEQGRKPVYGVQAEAKPRDRVEVAISSEADRDSIDVLFQAFCRARERAGNEAPIDPTRFEELVTTKLREVKTQKDCFEVVFVVAEENGKVQLKTRTGK